MKPEFFMRKAINQALYGISANHGGPFGCVIVKSGKIIGQGHNCVLLKKDPTCHGEMEAIRDACSKLSTYDLSECELYTTAEPCPMCLGAIMWANIKCVYYGCTKEDSATIGFRDDMFYHHLAGDVSCLTIKQLERKQCMEVFDIYSEKDDKIPY